MRNISSKCIKHTCHCYSNFFSLSVVQMFWCADIKTSIFCCHISDGKQATSFLSLTDFTAATLFRYIVTLLFGLFSRFSPCDNWWRETVHTAVQIQYISFFNFWSTRDLRFSCICRANINKIFKFSVKQNIFLLLANLYTN